jgi:hypothetical protein
MATRRIGEKTMNLRGVETWVGERVGRGVVKPGREVVCCDAWGSRIGRAFVLIVSRNGKASMELLVGSRSCPRRRGQTDAKSRASISETAGSVTAESTGQAAGWRQCRHFLNDRKRARVSRLEQEVAFPF